MKYLVAFFTLITIGLSQNINIIPNCYVVKHETYIECFTYTPGLTGDREYARQQCDAQGGQLPIVTNGTVWKMITDNLLQGGSKYVWTGFTVVFGSKQYTPNVKFTDMESNQYLKPVSYSVYYGDCVCAYPTSWYWTLAACSTSGYEYMCQFNVSHCNISKIDSPNINVKSCFTIDSVPNNTVVEIECANGYYLNSSTNITCRNGIWEKAHCIPGCPPPGQREHATLTLVKTYYNIGEKIYYFCEDEHFSWKDHRMTHFTLNCQQDSTWSDKDARCTRRNKFSTVVIDVNEINSNSIELECQLNALDKSWYHNGRYVRSSTTFKITTVGNLIINTSAGKINGIYFCHGKVDDGFQAGNLSYQIVGKNDCKSHIEYSVTKQTVCIERQNIFLQCPQEYEDFQVKWFKDEKEFISNSHGNVITGKGLFIENAQLFDEGTYKCQTTYREDFNNCKYNVTHRLYVTASAESVCGSTSAQNKTYQPWLTVLHQNDENIPFCYGTLLNNNWVVTSAFCLSRLQHKKEIVGISVILGPEGKQKRYPINSIKVHPKYRSRQNQNDIGLIQLQGHPVKFTTDILPACISPTDIGNVHKCEYISDINGTIAGWGPLVVNFDNMILDTEEMGIIPKEKCRSVDTLGFAEDKFCAKFIGDDEIFAGDSGSPFLVTHKGRQYLLGIYTWGERETRMGDYDFYTSIYHHYKWIKETIK